MNYIAICHAGPGSIVIVSKHFTQLNTGKKYPIFIKIIKNEKISSEFVEVTYQHSTELSVINECLLKSIWPTNMAVLLHST